MQPTVFLFDIDGTLISADGAGRRALERAFLVRHGRPGALEFRFDGMTDPRIMEQALTRMGFESSSIAEESRLLLEHYLEALAEEVTLTEHYRVHPGVEPILAELAAQEGVAIGLGTGNLERGARIKLHRGGLDRHFAFGGFGSDHGVRAELLRIGAERGAALLNRTRSACRVVVIGDTPKDIEAAHAIGAECLAVATGHYEESDLQRFSPALVASSLEQPNARRWLLGESLAPVI